MTVNTIKRVYASTIKKYIAKDGKEFDKADECIIYESELDLNRLANKYKMKFVEVPTFICSDDHVHGISFHFPQDGNEDEVERLLYIFQNYEIDKNDNKWEIDWNRNLSNVHGSAFEIKIPSLNKGDSYIFYFCWEEHCDDYDYFYNEVVSKEKAMAKLENEMKNLNAILFS